MKKYIGRLLLFLLLFALLPQGFAESETAGLAPQSPVASGAAIPRVNPPSFEGVRDRFANQQQDNPPADEEPFDAQDDELDNQQPSQITELPQTAQGDLLIEAKIQLFGGRGNEKLLDAISLSDGGFLLVGISGSAADDLTNQSHSAWALRFAKNGKLLWEYRHETNAESDGYFTMAKENKDGTILLAHLNILFGLQSYSLITLSPDGELIEESQLSSLVYDLYRALDGIIVDSGSGLTKYDENLSVQYELEVQMLQHIIFKTEDGLLFYGYLLRADSLLGDATAFLINENGDILWDLNVWPNARFEGCLLLSDGDYLCTGYMENEYGRESGLAARISPDGTIRYAKEYSRDGEFYFISHAYELNSGALLVGGTNRNNKVYLLHVNDDGNEIARYAVDLGRRIEMTSTPLRILQAGSRLFVVGDVLYYRNLLQPEDADIFVVPLVLPVGGE